MNIKNEIDSARCLGGKLEDLVVSKKQCHCAGNSDRIVIGYWALAFDYHKGILALLSNDLRGSAFALLRPIVEASIRAHVALIGSEEDLRKIMDDTYMVNFKTVGGQIDIAFGLEGYFERFLNGALGALHSYTHSGLSQLGRRFKGDDLMPSYTDEETVEMIRIATTAVFMVTLLTTKHFKFEDEWKAATELSIEWGKHDEPKI